MSRLILLALAAAVGLAVVALVISIASGGSQSDTAQRRSTGIQKVAYAVLIAVMFGVASGALSDA
ncbi:hypothetical protein ACS3SW_08595 [Roseobacteraceae bacterium S113]